MLTNYDFDYRNLHGVVPQLDRVNNKNCLNLIPKTPVVHSKFATMGNVLKSANVGKIAGGVGNSLTGMLHLASGNFGYGLGKLAQGTIGMATGAVDPTKTSIDAKVVEMIQESEIRAWDRYNFLQNFVPAQGNLGDICFKDGSCDDFHCGNGFRIFDNGDYFEGYWEDGEIKWGIYIWADGERYLGNFDEGNKHQYGLNIYTDGSYYDGEYCNGDFHGSGSRIYLDGVYSGDWLYNMRHGFGVCKFADGTSFAGNWESDEPVE